MIFLALISGALAAPFYDCAAATTEMTDSVLKAYLEANSFKFSSECLDTLLRRQYFVTAEFLLDSYYPNTQIDTEVTIQGVIKDAKRD